MLLCQRFWCADKLNIISDYYIVYCYAWGKWETNAKNKPPFLSPHLHTSTHTHWTVPSSSFSIFAGSFQQRMASRKNKNKIKNYWSHWAQGETTQEKKNNFSIFVAHKVTNFMSFSGNNFLELDLKLLHK